MEERLRAILLHHFRGARVELERALGGTRIGGVLVWNGFARKKQLSRQRELWDVLRHELPPEDLLQVGLVLTVTEEEQDLIVAD